MPVGMKNALTRMLYTVVFSALLFFAISCLAPFSARAELPSSGTCGANSTYSYNRQTHVLTISGTGAAHLPYKDGMDRTEFLEHIVRIVINEGITDISNEFAYAPELRSVVLPSTITDFSFAFYSCDKLKSVTLPEGITSISAIAFAECHKLENITIPSTVTEIERAAFDGCYSLKLDTVIHNGVTSIGDTAFRNCKRLTSLRIPKSVTYINDRAFKNCTGLTEVVFEDNGDPGSYDNSLTMGSEIFMNCSNLVNVIFSNRNAHIGGRTFSGCTHLQNVYFYGLNTPYVNHNTGAPDSAFDGCNENVVVYCYSGSWTHSQAEEYGPNFILLDGPYMVMSLKENAQGKDIHKIVYEDGYFRATPTSTGRTFYLAIKANNVDRYPIHATITLPEGLSFSNSSVVSQKTVSYGGGSTKTVETGYTLYTVEKEQYVTSIQFQAIGTAVTGFVHTLGVCVSPPPAIEMTLSEEWGGLTIDPLYYADGVFKTSFDSEDDTLLLNVKATDVELFAVEDTITLPHGLSFSQDSVVLTQSICLGGMGESDEEKTYEVYPYQYFQTVDMIRITAAGTATSTLIVNVTSSPISMALYNLRLSENEVSDKVSSLEYNDGNFTTGSAADDDVFYLKVSVEDTKGMTLNESITLPDGLSFSDTSVESTCPVTLGENGKTKDSEILEIYSVCKIQSVNNIVISAKGDYPCTEKWDITNGNGYVLVPGSSGISYTPVYSEPSSVYWGTLLSDGYSENACKLGVDLSFSTYSYSYIRGSLHNLGFSDIESFSNNTTDGVAHYIGQKKINENGTIRTVVILAIRGTVGWQEWIGNLIVGDADTPDSFTAAATTVHNNLMEYCGRHEIQQSDAIVFCCGHSRGGAVANIVGHWFNKVDNWRNFCVYTFAAPNSTKANDTTDKNIFNYLFAHDVVGYVPTGYEKYGTTYVVGAQSGTPSAVASAYQNYTSRPYQKPNSPLLIDTVFVLGEEANGFATGIGKNVLKRFFHRNDTSIGHEDGGDRIWDVRNAHSAENYMAWVRMNGTSGNVSFDYICNEYKKMASIQRAIMKIGCKIPTDKRIQVLIVLLAYLQGGKTFENMQPNLYVVDCPVDINLCDADGMLVASVVNHQAINSDEDQILAITDEETSYFIFPSHYGYSFQITGTGDGTMDIDMRQIGPDFYPVDSAAFTNVPVTLGEQFTLSSMVASLSESNLISNQDDDYIPDGRAQAQCEKLVRTLRALIPGYFDVDQAPQIADGLVAVLENCDNALFVSASNSEGISISRSTLGEVVTSSYSQQLYTGGDIASVCIEGHSVYILPYDVDYVVSFHGISDNDSFDVGLGLFDKDYLLLDTAAFTQVPFGPNRMLTLTQNGAYPGKLSVMQLYDGDGAWYSLDRWRDASSIKLPKALRVIEEEAFEDSQSMTGHVAVPSNVSSIGARAFAGTGISSLTLPEGLSSIAEDAFDGMTTQPILIVSPGSYAEEWVKDKDFPILYSTD